LESRKWKVESGKYFKLLSTFHSPLSALRGLYGEEKGDLGGG
jgi:hypothetical protein